MEKSILLLSLMFLLVCCSGEDFNEVEKKPEPKPQPEWTPNPNYSYYRVTNKTDTIVKYGIANNLGNAHTWPTIKPNENHIDSVKFELYTTNKKHYSVFSVDRKFRLIPEKDSAYNTDPWYGIYSFVGGRVFDIEVHRN